MSELNILISLSFLLYVIGFYGLMTKSDAVKIIIAIELMLIASNILFVAFGYLREDKYDPLAQSYAILSLSIGGTIIGLALAIALIIQKRFDTVDVSKLNKLRW
ncbi:MAG: F(420)H(2) dehydrogenase subunit K [Candidatus Heimdallarchaeota archaeon LC_2]|nr:MAG: F(420)H(2) dehydrogenase subunit K [Candidatus Heimdallarchaeota archaeon LC_2]